MDVLSQEMYKAAIRGDVQSVLSLLEQGADINYKAWGDRTALMEAAAYGHATLVTFLPRPAGEGGR